MKALSFVNWALFAAGLLSTLLYAVVCLITWPFPQMAARAGTDFGRLLGALFVAAGFTLIAALTTWLLDKRHGAWWLAECLLAAALAGVFLFVYLGD